MKILFGLMVLAVLFPLAGGLYQHFGKIRDARRFPVPGRMVDIGGTRLHLDESGQGSPAVVFEAGIGATSLSWRLVQPEIARLTRTASYDRAWLGWSETSPHRRGVWQVVEELHSLLNSAGLQEAPCILVAHSYGGLLATAYASRYPAEISGIVLVDPLASSEWSEPSKAHRRMLRRAIVLSRRGALLARFGVVRFALTLLSRGSQTLPKLIARASSGRGAAFTERLVGQVQKLPREVWPMIQSHWCDPKSFEGMARYLEALPESAAAANRPPETPLIVLSSANASPAQRAAHERLAGSHGRVEVVPGSGHWIQLDRPDVVIRAIGDMVARCRS